jgi:hypothetical protein
MDENPYEPPNNPAWFRTYSDKQCQRYIDAGWTLARSDGAEFILHWLKESPPVRPDNTPPVT